MESKKNKNELRLDYAPVQRLVPILNLNIEAVMDFETSCNNEDRIELQCDYQCEEKFRLGIYRRNHRLV